MNPFTPRPGRRWPDGSESIVVASRSAAFAKFEVLSIDPFDPAVPYRIDLLWLDEDESLHVEHDNSYTSFSAAVWAYE